MDARRVLTWSGMTSIAAGLMIRTAISSVRSGRETHCARVTRTTGSSGRRSRKRPWMERGRRVRPGLPKGVASLRDSDESVCRARTWVTNGARTWVTVFHHTGPPERGCGMPWEVLPVSELRLTFVHQVVTLHRPILRVCADFHICRKTGSKWLRRYREEPADGLKDRSRRPFARQLGPIPTWSRPSSRCAAPTAGDPEKSMYT
jgi:hypothetical protein